MPFDASIFVFMKADKDMSGFLPEVWKGKFEID
ncbi:hypothetical protein IPA_08195 [Ignicoccus pacificus DSM 13166]|uniref:Uncharacterized protein n=1 Tax=Ignicoccus pacificus DSM 13166 TaxID=940294 RepID=A0A977KBW9_9CREN|nr:hypothetical protein IPA_08195 [Ignicoccus pacificus DSM 13166]